MANTLTSTLTEAVLDTYSDHILNEALPNMRWLQFAVIREDLRKEPGDSIIFTKLDDLTGDPALVEDTDMTTDALLGSTLSITVAEYGKAFAVRERLQQLSWMDVLKEGAKKLGRHYSIWGPEKLIQYTAMTGAGTVLYGGDQTARTNVTSVDTFDITLVRNAVETLESANVPLFMSPDGDEFYVCFIHPHQARFIREDSEWVSAQNYHATRAPFTGEIGRFENVVFMNSSALYNGGAATATSIDWLDINANAANDLVSGEAGNQTDIYQSCLFGDSFYGFASALPVEMRASGVQDFGRLHSLAWYAIYGAGILHATNGVRLETA